jgi:GrpB-like predicted nucleotidyltransferase (UPF0157 family)
LSETLQEKIDRVLCDRVEIRPYDDNWPEMFASERQHLLDCLPTDLIVRIEHFGSTAVPGLVAKPIVDMLIEVTSLETTRKVIAPILEAQGYDYFWRPAMFEGPPFYAWFIKRDSCGQRTHHLHMVEKDSQLWPRLLFSNYLRRKPDLARQYGQLKLDLALQHPGDRVAYTKGKTDFITRVTSQAKGDR